MSTPVTVLSLQIGIGVRAVDRFQIGRNVRLTPGVFCWCSLAKNKKHYMFAITLPVVMKLVFYFQSWNTIPGFELILCDRMVEFWAMSIFITRV